MITVSSILRELIDRRNPSLFPRLDIIDLSKFTLKARVYVASDIFVQVYRNDKYDTTNFVLIIGDRRIYARDEIDGR
ncbi:MAG: hypothetical protein ACUVXI_05270 [bacterium]